MIKWSKGQEKWVRLLRQQIYKKKTGRVDKYRNQSTAIILKDSLKKHTAKENEKVNEIYSGTDSGGQKKLRDKEKEICQR